MSDQHNPFEHLKTVGGVLCLDFANTVSRRDTDLPTERLHAYEDLVAWAAHVEIVSPELGQALVAEAAQRPTAAMAVYEQALALREALFRLFARTLEGAPPAAADLAVLNAQIASSYAHLRLAPGVPNFAWVWDDGAHHLDRILWPIVRSAAEELTSGELDRVRMCAGEHCGWLFVDRSKNRSRRWCDMQDCGNVEKVRRYRRRQKE